MTTKTHCQCIGLSLAVETEAVIISGSLNDILRAGIQDIVLTFCNWSNFHLTCPTITSHLRRRSVKNYKTLSELTNLFISFLINFNGFEINYMRLLYKIGAMVCLYFLIEYFSIRADIAVSSFLYVWCAVFHFIFPLYYMYRDTSFSFW